MTNIKRESAGTPTGGQFQAHTRSGSPVELSQTTATFTLDDGQVHTVPASISERFRGVSAEGYNLVAAWENPDGSEYLTGLTPCCNASATGTEDGICCRSCYSECDPALGGEYTLNQDGARAVRPG